MLECRMSRSRPRPPQMPRERDSRRASFLHALDLGTENPKAFVDALITALDLADVVDDALPPGAECGKEDGHAGADVGRLHVSAAKLRWADNHCAVGIAEDDLRAHTNELVDEEHARLEHLLVHHD